MRIALSNTIVNYFNLFQLLPISIKMSKPIHLFWAGSQVYPTQHTSFPSALHNIFQLKYIYNWVNKHIQNCYWKSLLMLTEYRCSWIQFQTFEAISQTQCNTSAYSPVNLNCYTCARMFSSIITLSILVPYEWKNKLNELDASTKISS